MSSVWVAVVLSGAGTYAMRASFLAFAHRMARVPAPLARVLRQIPPAALASIVLPAVVRPEGQLGLAQPRLAAGVVATAIAWRTRSVGLTLLVGMAVLMVLEAL